MNLENHIIELLGLQDVEIEDIKRSKKRLSFEIRVRQKRSECFCRSIADYSFLQLRSGHYEL